MMVLMRSMGMNLMGEFFSDSEMDFMMISSSFARSAGRPFFTSNMWTRWLASASLSKRATKSIKRRMLRRLSRISIRFAGG